ncbi:MAG: hypothetical protein H6657_07735 [Ardenticatenaceae bacterium]|nr:hypothetical protein [Ardenticatenaceae bacterium]
MEDIRIVLDELFFFQLPLATTALVGCLLADPVVDRLSMVRRLLRLREQVAGSGL